MIPGSGCIHRMPGLVPGMFAIAACPERIPEVRPFSRFGYTLAAHSRAHELIKKLPSQQA